MKGNECCDGLEKVQALRDAPEYKALVSLRDKAADYHSFIIEGLANQVGLQPIDGFWGHNRTYALQRLFNHLFGASGRAWISPST
jgi:hypothetical protein